MRCRRDCPAWRNRRLDCRNRRVVQRSCRNHRRHRRTPARAGCDLSSRLPPARQGRSARPGRMRLFSLGPLLQVTCSPEKAQCPHGAEVSCSAVNYLLLNRRLERNWDVRRVARTERSAMRGFLVVPDFAALHPGYALSFQPTLRRPLETARGPRLTSVLSFSRKRGAWSAAWRIHRTACVRCRTPRLAALHSGSRHRLSPVTQLRSALACPRDEPGPSASSSHRGRSAPRAGPEPPGCVAANHARGRRTSLPRILRDLPPE